MAVVGIARRIATNVTTASVQICPDNQYRKGFFIFNNSSNTVYLSFENPCVAAQCIRTIGSFTHWECGPTVWTGKIYAIRNSGSGIVSFWELE